MAVCWSLRTQNFESIQVFQESLKTALKRLETHAKSKDVSVVQVQSKAAESFVSNALRNISLIVRCGLSDEKTVELLSDAYQTLHLGWLRIQMADTMITDLLVMLRDKALELLPSGTCIQLGLLTSKETQTCAKPPILTTITEWWRKNVQRLAWLEQRQRDKKYVDTINSGKRKPETPVQLVLDLESVTPAKPQPSKEQLATMFAVYLEPAEAAIPPDDTHPVSDSPAPEHTAPSSLVQTLENLTLRMARKVAGVLGIPQKVQGYDVPKYDLIKALRQACQEDAARVTAVLQGQGIVLVSG